MARLDIPTVAVVIGEGGSGGAVAIAVADRVLMQENAIYSVISPEGCASILYKSADKAEMAAEAMGITAERLQRLKLVDDVIPEPLGGAHRDTQAMATSLKHALAQTLATLQAIPLDALLVQRRKRLASYGVYKEA